MSLKPGDVAPDFTLVTSNKEKVTLSEYRDKNVVLLFFPFAFTGVCTAELCSVRDNMQAYNDLNAEVMAISVDSIFTLAKFREEQGYNFRLLSDFNKEVSTLYGCLYEVFGQGMRGVSKRSAFVIDGQGIIRYAEVLENAGEVPDFNAINETLKTLN